MSGPASPHPNPIFERLTRGGQWPSEHSALWIGAVIVMVLALNAATVMLSSRLDVVLGRVVLGIGPALGILCPLISFIVAAAITGHLALDEDFGLLRMSNLSAETIAAGYAESALYRLRTLRALSLWMPAVSIGTEFVLGMAERAVSTAGCHGPQCLLDIQMRLLIGGPAVLIAIALEMGLINLVSQSMVKVGVWVGLRWARAASGVASVVTLIVLSATSLALVIGLSTSIYPIQLGVCFTVVVAPSVLISRLEVMLRKSSIRYIGRRIGVQAPPHEKV